MTAARQPDPPRSETIMLDGLKGPVEIDVDRWGIAHIRAGCRDDLFLAQGFNAARDRLWQIDLWRKRGLGLLAADFGPGYLEQDRAARLFLYRGDMAAEWAAYGEDAQAICTAFVAGVNARVARVLAGDDPLPQEFALLDTRPAPWAPEDVVRIRSHCLTRNALSEVLRATLIDRASPAADALRVRLEPDTDIAPDPALPLAATPPEVLDLFRLAMAPVTFSHERLAATLQEAPRWRKVDALNEVVRDAAATEGSNNWAVSGVRTATGRPILAMDPHRLHAIPALRYLVHLSMPGFDAIGGGEPAVPGISYGHNGRIGFSITIFGADQEDVCVYDTAPDDPQRYRYGEGHESLHTVDEAIAVRGHPDQTVTLEFTRHGPVIHRDPAAGRAIALRTVWSEPGSAPYMASLQVMRAGDFEGYRKALRGWGTPSTNHVYADAQGHIGWQAVGKTPIRPNWNGLLPVCGDGSHEWAGFVPPDQLPWSFDPPEGFIATANEFNLPPAWQQEGRPPIGHEWLDPSRAQRIREVLRDQPAHTLEMSCRLQNDILSIPARRVLAVLARLPLTAAAAPAARHLAAWDCVATAASSPAALFEVWMTAHLRPALFARVADPALHPLMLPGDVQAVLQMLEAPDHGLQGGAHALAALVSQTLAAAWDDLGRRFGADPAGWRWGALHRLDLRHAASPLAGDGRLDLPVMELGGTASTPNYAVYRPGDFGVTTGPSIRLVLDVGDWDRSVFVAFPGQSGDPGSPHYRDLAEDWRDGVYHPLAYSRAAVAAVTAHRIALVPAAAGGAAT